MYMLSGMRVLIDFDQQSHELSIVGNNLDICLYVVVNTLSFFEIWAG